MDKFELLEPLKLFNLELKNKHHENVCAYFDELVKSANINVSANGETCDKYYQKCNEINKLNNKLSAKKALKGLLIFLTVVLFIVAALFFYFIFANILELYIDIPISLVSLISAILLCVFAFKPINRAIKNFKALLEKYQADASALKNEAYNQLAPLNMSYDWNIPSQLFTKTCPLIEMDKILDTKKFEYLNEKYGLSDNTNPDQSTVSVQSGSILGNPFILRENYVTEMTNFTYSGSITIHWTTTESDDNGNTRTVSHSQVLTATVTKPKPIYYKDTWLIYGCDAAPNLSFSREPSNANNMSEKEIDKKSKKFSNVLDKKVKDSLTDDDPGTFTRLYNDEFEMLFHALDRDNDVEFRLLFTPLAQKSMLELIKSKVPYGDDFYFVKNKQLNFIKTIHSQSPNFDFFADPKQFFHFDLRKAREYFINFNDNYFQSFYFTLAPLLCIPLYQQTKTKEYIYKYDWPSNITSYEHEVASNQFDSSLFVHPETSTDAILKTKFISKDGNADNVEVIAHTYKAVEHISYIPVYGNDGYFHDVPVKWYEYRPLEQSSMIKVEDKKQTRQEYLSSNNTFETTSVFERGILARFINKIGNN